MMTRWPLLRRRVIAPTMTLALIPMMMRSMIICPVTTSRATSVLAVISPKPTVANTGDSEVQRVGPGHRLAEAAGREGGHDDVGAGEQQQEQRDAGGEGFDGPQPRVSRCADPANL